MKSWSAADHSESLAGARKGHDTVMIEGSRDRNVIVRHKFLSNGSTNVAPVFGITGENVEAITGLEQDEKRACHTTAAPLAMRGCLEGDEQRDVCKTQRPTRIVRIVRYPLGPRDRIVLRERDVMGLVSGLLNKQVGGELGTTEITVKGHRGQVMRKRKAESFADLVRMAARLNLPIAERRL